MSGKVGKRAKQATSRTDTSVGKSRRMRRSISPILLKFRKVYPSQTPHELSKRTGASTRHCERALGGHGALGEKFLIRLMRSDFGRDAYFALMAGCDQAWFVRLQRQFEISDARRTVLQAERSLQLLEAAE